MYKSAGCMKVEDRLYCCDYRTTQFVTAVTFCFELSKREVSP